MPKTLDVDAARRAGYSDEEIARHMGKDLGYNADAAIAAGAKASDIIEHLKTRQSSGFVGLLDAVKQAAKGGADEIWDSATGINDTIQRAFQGVLDTGGKAARGDFKGAGENLLNAATGIPSAMVAGNGQALQNAQKAYARGDYTQAAAHLFNWLAPGGAMVEPISQEIEQGKTAHALGRSVALGGVLAAPDSPIVRAGIAKVPEVIRSSIPVLPKMQNQNPAEAAAVQFGRDNGIPVSAKTATGNKFVGGVQAIVDHSPVGSFIAQHAKKSEAAAYTRVGGELAERASPGGSVAPTQAGAEITEQLHSNISGHQADANAAYGDLREIEADPANMRNVQVDTKKVPALDPGGNVIPGKFTDEPVMEDVPLPVDMRAVKKKLRPLYDQLTRQLPVTQQRMSTGLKAIENIITGKDAVSATTADLDLSAIKAAARGDDEVPELRSVSQGLAAQAVKELHEAVTEAVGRAERSGGGGGGGVGRGQAHPMETATDEYGDTVSQPPRGMSFEEWEREQDRPVRGSSAGQEALDALESGRQATKRKYESARVLKGLPNKGFEPRAVYEQAIWRNDSGIEHLRQVAKETPEQIPRLGRAVIEDLIDKATAEGGFDKTQSLFGRWQSIGPETKKILFPNPMLREDLDKFFLLAKKAGEVTNPSESATVGSITAGLGYVWFHPASGVPMVLAGAALSKLMHSPAGLRALIEGLRVPVAIRGAKTAAQGAQALAAAQRILKVAGADSRPLGNNVTQFPTQSTQQPARAANQ